MCYLDEIEPGLQLLDSKLNAYKTGFLLTCKAGFAEQVKGESAISMLDKARIANKNVRDDDRLMRRFYDEELDADIRFREYIVNHVDEAIEQGYLEVYYQPIIRAATGEVCNEEALSRWNDPVYGFLAPYRFIPPLEESRQIYKLSLNVVRQVLADFARKKELGMSLVPVSVNLSRHDFEQCDMVQAVSDLVDKRRSTWRSCALWNATSSRGTCTASRYRLTTWRIRSSTEASSSSSNIAKAMRPLPHRAHGALFLEEVHCISGYVEADKELSAAKKDWG